MRKYIFLCVVIPGLFLAGCGEENLQRSNPLDPQYSGNGVVVGSFFLNGQPMSGVSVFTTPATKTAMTDSMGAYTLSIPAGTYTVLAQAPWYAPVSSTQQAVTLGTTINVNFNPPNMTPNYVSPCIPDGFELYPSNFAPMAPWNCVSTGTGGITVDNAIFAMGVRSCRMHSGSNTGNNSKLQLFGINTKGVRITAKVRTENLNCNYKIGVSDPSGQTTEFGFDGLAFDKVRYKLPSGYTNDQTVTGGAIAVGTWYLISIEIDYETKLAVFQLWDSSKTTKYVDSGSISLSGTLGTIDKFYISNTNFTPAIDVTAYIDEITLVKK